MHEGSPDLDDEDELDEDMYEEEDDDIEDEVSFDSDDGDDAGPVASTSQPPTHGLSLRPRRGVPVPPDDAAAPTVAQLAQSIDVVRRYAPQSSNTRGSGMGDELEPIAPELIGAYGFAHPRGGVIAPEFSGQSSGNIDVTPAATRWNCSFLGSAEAAPSTALIILNEPIQHARLLQLWDKTSLHLFADGGANRVYDVLTPDERVACVGAAKIVS